MNQTSVKKNKYFEKHKKISDNENSSIVGEYSKNNIVKRKVFRLEFEKSQKDYRKTLGSI